MKFGDCYQLCLFGQLQTKFMKQCQEIKKNLTGRKKILISVFASFLTTSTKVLFVKVRLVVGFAPPFFETFPIFPNFLISAPWEATCIQCTTLLVMNWTYTEIIILSRSVVLYYVLCPYGWPISYHDLSSQIRTKKKKRKK